MCIISVRVRKDSPSSPKTTSKENSATTGQCSLSEGGECLIGEESTPAFLRHAGARENGIRIASMSLLVLMR